MTNNSAEPDLKTRSDKHELILEAAIRVFARNGYHGECAKHLDQDLRV